MPQLKIADVQTELRESIKRIEAQFGAALGQLQKNILEIKTQVDNESQDSDEDNTGGISERLTLIEHQIAFLREEMATKNDLVGHVETYNNHIIQQHAPKARK